MKIVCIGDSLTYGYGVPRRESWVSLCAQESGHAFVGRGVNGDTTGGMLARFSADVLPERPDAVLMMGGANDRFFSGFFGAAQANIMALAHRCCGCGMAPLIGIPIPLCPPIRDGWCELVDVDPVGADQAVERDRDPECHLLQLNAVRVESHRSSPPACCVHTCVHNMCVVWCVHSTVQ